MNTKNKGAKAPIFIHDFPTYIQSIDVLPKLTNRYVIHLNGQVEEK